MDFSAKFRKGQVTLPLNHFLTSSKNKCLTGLILFTIIIISGEIVRNKKIRVLLQDIPSKLSAAALPKELLTQMLKKSDKVV